MNLDPQEEMTLEAEQESQNGWLGSTLNVTLILLIFMVGLFVGFAGRPFIDNMAGLDARTRAAADSIGLDPSAIATVASEPDSAAAAITAAAMPALRHVYGEPDAPVTLIEFGDFL